MHLFNPTIFCGIFFKKCAIGKPAWRSILFRHRSPEVNCRKLNKLMLYLQSITPAMKFRLLLLIVMMSGKCFSQQIQVAPYIQPGNTPTLAHEEKVIIWQTDSIAGSFTVDY